jgi:hypothetical protein
MLFGAKMVLCALAGLSASLRSAANLPAAAHKIASKNNKYAVGDHVRISKHREVFDKGYTPNRSNEFFLIRKVKLTNPTTYLLKDMNGKDILGGFYEMEL